MHLSVVATNSFALLTKQGTRKAESQHPRKCQVSSYIFYHLGLSETPPCRRCCNMQPPVEEETTPTEEYVSRAGTPLNVCEETLLWLQTQETEDLGIPLLLDRERHRDAM